ncbi:MAG: MMPL family transporter [Oscillospiraceae bacterium]
MERIAEKIIAHKRMVLVIFLVLAVFSLLTMGGVKVNYDLVDYLPDGTPSTTALNVMNAEYTQATPNIRVYLPNVSIPEALKAKAELKALGFVENVSWLDDVINIGQPLELADAKTVDAYYKDGGALFSVTADKSVNAVKVVTAIRECVGADAAVAGETVDMAEAQLATQNEIAKIMITVVPMALLILFVTTRSWFEPVLFIIAIGVSILLNLGTNIFLKEVSFITQGVAPILQLAVSMDYAIFLLNAFQDYRESGVEIREAMRKAMVKSFSTVMASGLTTVLGFLALTLMRFKIGPDMGFVLAKGIFFSLISVLVFLPVVGVMTYKLIDKTKHRSFLPSFRKMGNAITAVRVPVLLLAFLLMVPCYLAQQSNTFRYGAASSDPKTKAGADTVMINDTFGKASQMALLVPRGEWGKEIALNDELKAIPEVTSVISYVNMVGTQIPPEFLPQDMVEQMLSPNYSRFIISLDMPDEGAEAFAVVKQVRGLVAEYYGNEYHLCGNSVNNFDMMTTVTADNVLVNAVAILAIGFVLLVTFKSISIPLLLLLTIEASIWMNLAFPYFMGDEIHYIGYLVINTVQLGATVDYAILLSERYLQKRQTLFKHEAIKQTIAETAPSILTSAGILTMAGVMIGVISTNAVVSQLGTVLGRGAAFSCIMVLLFLPAMLILCDCILPKTTYHTKFVFPEKKAKTSSNA